MNMAQDNAWQWDPTLFQGCAAHYDVGRIPYAEGLADALGLATPMHRTKGRLLDVGCGPGTIALRCAHLFDEVVGLDPDADMLREAARLAHTRGITNAQWVALRAEALPANLGLFRIVTFAASLHWLNRLQVFSTVRSMLVAGGVAVHVDNPGYRRDSAAITGSAFPSPPEQALEALRVRYLGTDRRAGQGIRNTSPDDEDAVFLAAGFAGPHIVTVPDGRVLVRSVDELVAERFSFSGTAPHLFGDQLPAFEYDLRALLWRTSPRGYFSVPLSDNLLKIWTPVSTG